MAGQALPELAGEDAGATCKIIFFARIGWIARELAVVGGSDPFFDSA
jgi:hypothetical protein